MCPATLTLLCMTITGRWELLNSEPGFRQKLAHSSFLPAPEALEACPWPEAKWTAKRESPAPLRSILGSRQWAVQNWDCTTESVPQCAILLFAWPVRERTQLTEGVKQRAGEGRCDLFLLWSLCLKDAEELPLVLDLPKYHDCVEAPAQPP